MDNTARFNNLQRQFDRIYVILRRYCKNQMECTNCMFHESGTECFILYLDDEEKKDEE